jgi:GDP/UDP-N,N'-diacetylbacillosamine 2-epimerase (hydrolysing)
MVGNSSSGLAEAPSFKIGTINIGDRQKGRIMADSVIDCDIKSIKDSFKKLYSIKFREKLIDIENPYGNGGASYKIKEKLKTIDLDDILKKIFYNLKEIK